MPPATSRPPDIVAKCATFKDPPKLVFVPTPNPPTITTAPLLGDIESTSPLTTRVSTDKGVDDDNSSFPSTLRFPSMETSPVLERLSV